MSQTEQLKKRLEEGAYMQVFSYQGKEGHIDPYCTRDGKQSFLLWYDGKEQLVDSLDAVWNAKMFAGKSLSEISEELTDLDWQ